MNNTTNLAIAAILFAAILVAGATFSATTTRQQHLLIRRRKAETKIVKMAIQLHSTNATEHNEQPPLYYFLTLTHHFLSFKPVQWIVYLITNFTEVYDIFKVCVQLQLLCGNVRSRKND
jgi:hypothetical protein